MNFSADQSSIVAGKPYIIKWETTGDNITDPVFTNVAISSTTTSTVETTYADFVGCYSPVAIEGEDRTMLYLGAENKLYYPNAALTINAFRGYFQLKGITAGDLPTSNVSTFVMNFDGDDGETTSLSPNPSPKGEGNWYSLDGRKLNGKPTAKGVYIYNGKKVIIK